MCMNIELNEVFSRSENINVYNDGKAVAYSAQDGEYKRILESWNKMLQGAHEMPAFGVSLNRETVAAMKRGLWLEFGFGKVYESNGMPFEKLLVDVKSEYSGFNLIRYTAERGYDGRCFYYDLTDKNMSELFNLLSKSGA